MQLGLAVAHAYKQQVDHLQFNLDALYNTVSEGIILLEPTETPDED